jgi:4-amino-4-deoxy-L-arabinose transferase-like glycosyltransferase
MNLMAIFSRINRPVPDAAKARILNIGLLLGIVALGAYFRLVNLPSNPGWYYDEGVFINVADNLSHGHWQSFNMAGSPMLWRPPLFVYLLTVVFSLFGVGIQSARGLCAVFSLFELLLVYRIGRRAGGDKLGLLAAALFALLPQFVEFNRMAYSYSSTALFGLLGVEVGLSWLENRRSMGWLPA